MLIKSQVFLFVEIKPCYSIENKKSSIHSIHTAVEESIMNQSKEETGI